MGYLFRIANRAEGLRARHLVSFFNIKRGSFYSNSICLAVYAHLLVFVSTQTTSPSHCRSFATVTADSGASALPDKVDSSRGKETPAGSTVSASERILTLWFRREGDAGYAMVTANAGAFVGLLAEQIVAKLPSLREVDQSKLTFYAEDAEGKAVGKALDSTETIEEALRGRTGKICLTIKVAGSAAPATPG